MWRNTQKKLKTFQLVVFFIPLSYAIKIIKTYFFTLEKHDNNKDCEEHFSRSWAAEIRKSHRHVLWSMNHLSSFIEFYELFFDAKTLSSRLHAFLHFFLEFTGKLLFWIKSESIWHQRSKLADKTFFFEKFLTPIGLF